MLECLEMFAIRFVNSFHAFLIRQTARYVDDFILGFSFLIFLRYSFAYLEFLLLFGC